MTAFEYKEFDLNQLKNILAKDCLAFVPNFVWDKQTQDLFHDLLLYFLNEDGKFDTNKSLWIKGGVGTGKTKTMQIFSNFTTKLSLQKKFNVFSSLDIAQKFNMFGHEGLLYLKENQKQTEFGTWNNNYQNICIDDLGIEPEKVSYYGNEYPVIETLYLSRYDYWSGFNLHTHITTNLDNKTIKERYGERTISRIREMYNIVKLTGKDRR